MTRRIKTIASERDGESPIVRSSISFVRLCDLVVDLDLNMDYALPHENPLIGRKSQQASPIFPEKISRDPDQSMKGHLHLGRRVAKYPPLSAISHLYAVYRRMRLDIKERRYNKTKNARTFFRIPTHHWSA
jgi:hypothetical protein